MSDNRRHGINRRLNSFDKAKLVAGPVEVMTWTFCFEINVTLQVIGQETDADLLGHELSGKNQILPLGFGQDISSTGDVALDDCFEYGKGHINL